MQSRRAIVTLAAVGVLLFSAAAFAQTWDLKNDWNPSIDPNGQWSFLAGNTLLAPVYSCAMGGLPCGNYYSNGFLPLWSNADLSGYFSTNYYVPGDIWTHSNYPGYAIDTVRWTASTAGTISINGDIWFMQAPLNRSNDWSLYLNGTVLDSGTVSFSGGNAHDRNNPDIFSFSGLTVNAGDTVSLLISPTPGYTETMSGVNLTIVEGSSGVPEPASLVLLGSGVCAMAGFIRRRAASRV